MDSDYARKAYTEIRWEAAPDSKPLPAWHELQQTERELLIRMFIRGATFMADALRADAKSQQPTT